MGNALVQSATIQLKAQAGGGFGSVPAVVGVPLPTSLTLTGSGFGAVANSKPSAYDKFDEYDGVLAGQEIPRNADNANWVRTYNASYPGHNIPYTLNSELTLGDRPFSAEAGGQGKRSALRTPTIRPDGAAVDHNRIYLSWYIRFNESLDVPPQFSGGSAKLLRVWDEPSGNGMRLSWHTKLQGYSQMTPDPDETMWDTPNVWRRCEVYIDQTDGHILWVDGKKLGTIAGGIKGHEAGYTASPFYAELIGHDIRYTIGDATQDHTSTLKHWLADFFQYPSMARVELSNSPVFDDTVNQVRVLQEVSNRSDTLIEIPEPFYGELDQGATIYAHIIKADGTVINYGSVA